MQMTVSDTAATVMDLDDTLVQNLGPGTLYVGNSDVTASTGVEVGVGDAIALSNGNSTGLIADGGDCDVRYLYGACGITQRTAASVA